MRVLYDPHAPGPSCLAVARALGHPEAYVGQPIGPEGAAFFGTPTLLPLALSMQAAGIPFVYVDHGYIRKSGVYRMTRNALQVTQWGSATRRYDRIMAPWRPHGEHVLVCPPEPGHAAMLGVDSAAWLQLVLGALAVHTSRPVRVRPRNCPEPMAQDLQGCWCLVTWTSNAAVDAILAGIPAICTGPCAGGIISSRRLQDIERPHMSRVRQEWADWLVSNQWSLRECNLTSIPDGGCQTARRTWSNG